MSPRELVQAVQAAGGGVQKLDGGKAKLTGQIPAEVVAQIRENREAFLEAWDDELRGRWGRVPAEDTVMRSEPPRWRHDVYVRVERYVRRQGGDVCLWATLRATAYAEKNQDWTSAEATAAALDDVLRWQMAARATPDPVEQLKIFDEAKAYFTQNENAHSHTPEPIHR